LRLDARTWDRRVLTSQKNEYFYRGFHRLRKADYGNYIRPLDLKPIHYTLNVFRFWSDLITSKWVSSGVDYAVRGLSDSDEDQMRARAGYKIARHADEKLFTRAATVLDSKRCQFEGNLFWRVYYDPQAGARVKLPVTQAAEVPLGEDAYYCAECGHAEEGGGERWEMTGAPQCPNCGTGAVLKSEAPTVPVETVVGEQDAVSGEPALERVSVYNIKFNAGAGLEASSYVIVEELRDAEELRQVYGDLRMAEESATTTALSARESLERGAGKGDGEESERKRVKFTRGKSSPVVT